jgi:hypothetical protein
VKRLVLVAVGVAGLATVIFTALVLLGAAVVPAAVLAVGVSAALAIPVLLGARWLRSEGAYVEPRRTGRRVLGITVIATLGVGTFIAIYAAQLIPGNSYLGLFFAQLALALALIALAGAAAIGIAVVYWRRGRARPWAVWLAVAMAVYLALVGAVFAQVYLLGLAAGYGFGAYLSTRPAVTEAATT